jgi:hypothetical protein
MAREAGDLAREIAEVEDIERETNRSGVATRQAQQRLDETRQAIDLFQHAADRLFVLRRRSRVAQSHFADAANDGERRPELVRCVSGEPPKLAE